MRKATIAALEKMGERFTKAWKAGKSQGDTLEFESPAALFRVLTPKRWELIEDCRNLELAASENWRGSLRGTSSEFMKT